MKKKLFLYVDVGNTLIDCSTVFQNAAMKFNLTVKDITSVFNENLEKVTKGSISAKELWQKCIKKFNISEASNFDFLTSWVSDYKPILPMHNLLYQFKSSYHIGLLSNIYKGMLPLIKKDGNIPKIQYKTIIFSCDIGMMKPEQKFYEFAQDKAGVTASEIIYIDDRLDFLKPAANMGWKTLFFDFDNIEESVKNIKNLLLCNYL